MDPKIEKALQAASAVEPTKSAAPENDKLPVADPSPLPVEARAVEFAEQRVPVPTLAVAPPVPKPAPEPSPPPASPVKAEAAHINWADDEEEELPALDDWLVPGESFPPARSSPSPERLQPRPAKIDTRPSSPPRREQTALQGKPLSPRSGAGRGGASHAPLQRERRSREPTPQSPPTSPKQRSGPSTRSWDSNKAFQESLSHPALEVGGGGGRGRGRGAARGRGGSNGVSRDLFAKLSGLPAPAAGARGARGAASKAGAGGGVAAGAPSNASRWS